MDWAALLGVLTVAVGTAAGSGWIARDRERAKLERDVAMYQLDLPVAARESLARAIDARATAIRSREEDDFSRLGAYLHGLVLTWYLALLVYVAWRISHALTGLNITCLVVAIVLPAITFGVYAHRTDKRRGVHGGGLVDQQQKESQADPGPSGLEPG